MQNKKLSITNNLHVFIRSSFVFERGCKEILWLFSYYPWNNPFETFIQLSVLLSIKMTRGLRTIKLTWLFPCLTVEFEHGSTFKKSEQKKRQRETSPRKKRKVDLIAVASCGQDCLGESIMLIFFIIFFLVWHI